MTTYRDTALWVSTGTGRNFRWIKGVSFTAHTAAREAGALAVDVLPEPPDCCSWYPDNFWGSWRDVPEQCPKCGRDLPC